MSAADRPPPVTDDHDTAGFWEAARRGELAVKACSDCSAILHLPKAYCDACDGWNTDWQVVAPRGTLWSWTTTERELRTGFEPPYTVVLVELDDAPTARLVGRLDGRHDLRVGMPMRAVFERVGDDIVLPQWEPVTDDAVGSS